MKIKIIALGKIKETFLKDAINEYLKRIQPYVPLEIIELSPVEIKDKNLVQNALDLEAEKILLNIKPQSFVITLEIGGKMMSSEEFAEKFQEINYSGVGELVFVIGSSHGISKLVSNRANFKLSLSKMTFLHQFARLILLEQIYRTLKIVNNETYHK